MKRLIIMLFLSLCLWAVLPVCAQDAVHYYFRTMDIRNGLSQNTVYQILQDRKGFMWFGTKDGLNRYDGLSFRIYKKENSGLGKNFITALYEDRRGNIWIGTDGGVFIYDPVLDSFTAFDEASDNGSIIRDFVTMIGSDEDDNIWISVENQGLFCYKPDEGRLLNHLHDSGLPNVTRFWLNGNTCWLALYADNLYYTKADFETPLQPFKDAIRTELLVVLVRQLELRRCSHRAVLRHVLNLVVEQQVGSVGELQIVGYVRHRVGEHLDIGLYAAAVAHDATRRRAELMRQRVSHVLARIPLVRMLVFARLNATARRYVVLRRSQLQLAVVG